MGIICKNCFCLENEEKYEITSNSEKNITKFSSLILKYRFLINNKLDPSTNNNFFNSEFIRECASFKIQSKYRGYKYRSKFFQKKKEELIREENNIIKNIEPLFYNTQLKSSEKLFKSEKVFESFKKFYKDDNLVKKFFQKEKIKKKNKGTRILINKRNNNYISYYKGETNNEGIPEGIGILYDNKGRKYEGKFKKGIYNGFGKYIDEEGICYEGDFKEGVLNGKGLKIISYSNYIMGNFKDGMLYGEGKEENEEYIYEGLFLNNIKYGKGSIYFKNSNDIYTGDFENDNIEGFGKYIWNNNHIYEGYFINGIMNGKGIYSWPEGSQYIGYYVNGLREGFGQFKFINGNIFEGEFKKGKPDGKGKYIMNEKEISVEYSHGKLVGNIRDSLIKLIQGIVFN